MKKTLLTSIILGETGILMSTASAARVYTQVRPVAEDPSQVDILFKLDSEGSTISSLDGVVQVAGFSNLIKSIHTGGSVFSLWPEKPSIQGDMISFVGGSPAGTNTNDALLFTVRTTSPLPQSSYISYGKIIAYEKETGASVEIVENPIEIKNVPTVSSLTTGKDITPPQPFSIELARDPSVYDGRYFISFSTSDTESGINHYEVKEGNADPIRSGSPYVLQDQTRKSTIIVSAVDNNGNVRTEKLHAPLSITAIVFGAIVFVALVAFVYKKYRR